MMWTAFEVAINALQAVLMIFFVKSKMPSKKDNAWCDVGAAILIAAFLSLYLFLDVPVSDTIVFLLPLIYTFVCLEGKWHVKILWNVALAAIFLAVTEVGMNLFLLVSQVPLEVIMAKTENRISAVVFCNVLLIAVLFSASQNTKRMVQLSPIAMTLFCVVEVVHLFAIETVFALRLGIEERDGLFTVANLCLFLSAIGVMVLFDMMNRLAEKNAQVMSEAETLRLTQKHQDEMKTMYTYLLSRQHDLGKQYQVVEQLLAEGHKSEGEAFLSELEKLPCIDAFMTGNTAVDALLTIKKLETDRSGIKFVFRPAPLHHLPMMETDFCAVIANLLDNAIEANVPSMAKKQVVLTFTHVWNMFLINCENTTIAPKEEMSHSASSSTKRNHLGHGFGMQNVVEIVNRYHGTYTHECDGHLYTVHISLPMKGEQNGV